MSCTREFLALSIRHQLKWFIIFQYRQLYADAPVADVTSPRPSSHQLRPDARGDDLQRLALYLCPSRRDFRLFAVWLDDRRQEDNYEIRCLSLMNNLTSPGLI